MNIRPHLTFLKILSTLPPKRRRELVREASCSDIKNVSEVCLNLLCGSIPISPDNLPRLKKYKRLLRYVGYKTLHKSPQKLKRFLLQQKGSGFFASVVPILVSILLDFLKPPDGEEN